MNDLDPAEDLIWQQPTRGSKWHIFRQGESLCGKYDLDVSDHGRMIKGFEPVDPESVGEGGPNDCSTCVRILHDLDQE